MDPHHGENKKEQPEAMELPDDLNLDQGQEDEEGEEGQQGEGDLWTLKNVLKTSSDCFIVTVNEFNSLYE